MDHFNLQWMTRLIKMVIPVDWSQISSHPRHNSDRFVVSMTAVRRVSWCAVHAWHTVVCDSTLTCLIEAEGQGLVACCYMRCIPPGLVPFCLGCLFEGCTLMVLCLHVCIGLALLLFSLFYYVFPYFYYTFYICVKNHDGCVGGVPICNFLPFVCGDAWCFVVFAKPTIVFAIALRIAFCICQMVSYGYSITKYIYSVVSEAWFLLSFGSFRVFCISFGCGFCNCSPESNSICMLIHL